MKLHHEGDAESLWRKMEKTLTGEGRENRGWILYAREKADALLKGIKRRREAVEEELARALRSDNPGGTPGEHKYAVSLYKDIVNRFDAYPDVADLVATAKEKLSAEEVKSSAETGMTKP
jgi:hypothetical protein